MIKPSIINIFILIIDGFSSLSLALFLPLLFAINSRLVQRYISYGPICLSSNHRLSCFYNHSNIALALYRCVRSSLLTLKRRSNRFYSTYSPFQLFYSYYKHNIQLIATLTKTNIHKSLDP